MCFWGGFHVFVGWLPCACGMASMCLWGGFHVFVGWLPCVCGVASMCLWGGFHVFVGWLPCVCGVASMCLWGGFHVFVGWLACVMLIIIYLPLDYILCDLKYKHIFVKSYYYLTLCFMYCFHIFSCFYIFA